MNLVKIFTEFTKSIFKIQLYFFTLRMKDLKRKLIR